MGQAARVRVDVDLTLRHGSAAHEAARDQVTALEPRQQPLAKGFHDVETLRLKVLPGVGRGLIGIGPQLVETGQEGRIAPAAESVLDREPLWGSFDHRRSPCGR